jgi:hypothetical protein
MYLESEERLGSICTVRREHLMALENMRQDSIGRIHIIIIPRLPIQKQCCTFFSNYSSLILYWIFMFSSCSYYTYPVKFIPRKFLLFLTKFEHHII